MATNSATWRADFVAVNNHNSEDLTCATKWQFHCPRIGVQPQIPQFRQRQCGQSVFDLLDSEVVVSWVYISSPNVTGGFPEARQVSASKTRVFVAAGHGTMDTRMEQEQQLHRASRKGNYHRTSLKKIGDLDQ